MRRQGIEPPARVVHKSSVLGAIVSDGGDSMSAIRFPRAHLGQLALIAAWLVVPCVTSAAPESEGLVLWLDADDAPTLSRQDDGTIRDWADKSKQGNHATQPQATSRPRYVPSSLHGKPAV